MKRIARYWKIILFDTLGVLLLIASLLTGWLPGPGGIPLLIAGLGLLAINHEWAARYIELVRKYADRIGELIFRDNLRLQRIYDATGITAFMLSVGLLLIRPNRYILSIAIIVLFLSTTLLLGNRGRFDRIKQKLKRK